MIRKWMLLICMCFCAGMVLSQPISERVLVQKIQQAQSPGLKHFGYLRFYLPSNVAPDRPGLWERWFTSKLEKEHQRALAFYLFNRYVTINSHKQASSSHALTLNDLGVFDGFMLCAEPFDFQNAANFYQKNQAEVHAWLNQFFSVRSFPWARPAKLDYERWVKQLEDQPQRQSQVVYRWPLPNLLNTSIPHPLSTRLLPFLKSALEQGKQKVVLYDVAAASLEDLDTHIGTKQPHRERTYRWVADECNYMSYLIAKTITADVLQHSEVWKFTRVYTLTAYPAQGEFLTPAQGARFVLANGQNAPPWRYHTVVVAVIPYSGGSYVPVVLDIFLGGMHPMTVGEWLAHFSPQTVFAAVPFLPNDKIEKALQVPNKIVRSNVWVNGKEYSPAKVMK